MSGVGGMGGMKVGVELKEPSAVYEKMKYLIAFKIFLQNAPDYSWLTEI